MNITSQHSLTTKVQLPRCKIKIKALKCAASQKDGNQNVRSIGQRITMRTQEL
jgi:hypothetical protein